MNQSYMQRMVEEKYFELQDLFNSDWHIATALASFMDMSHTAIYHRLNRFSFGEKESLKQFATAMECVQEHLKKIKIECNALFISKDNNPHSLIMLGKKLSKTGVRVLCPQLFISGTATHDTVLNPDLMINILQQDMKLADFIIVAGLNSEEMKILKAINQNKLKIINVLHKEEIKKMAMHITINKKGGYKCVFMKKNAA